MVYTKNFLQKLELFFEELGYVVRYEKGSFQSGYAIVERRNVIVVNKFLETEGRINSLLSIFDRLLPQWENSETLPTEGGKNWESSLSEKSQKLVKTLKNRARENDTDEFK